jgi:hypothetical protein
MNWKVIVVYFSLLLYNVTDITKSSALAVIYVE